MEQEFIVKLSTAVYGGDTLGRLPDGRAVFVPLALPGETVRLRLVEEKRGHARAELLEVLQPAPERVAAPCPHYGACGGCHYQHIAYPHQVALKTAILREQLERIGGIINPAVEACVPAPEPFFYRNHVQLHLTPQGQLGYYRLDGQAVIPVEACLLPEAPIGELWPQLNFEGLTSEIERIAIRLGAGDDLQIILESGVIEPPEISVEELPVSVIHLSPAGSLVLAGSPAVWMQTAGKDLRVSAGSFYQVNTAMAAAMIEHLSTHLDLTPEMIVIDVYCGVGLFSAFLAPKVARLIGIESSPSACEDFVYNLDAYVNVELYEAPAEDVLANLNIRPDLILVDPPRSGLHRRALDGLLALNAPLLVYISCDPATLARDARRLVQGGYRLKTITPFDLFPQTYHIESISIWEK